MVIIFEVVHWLLVNQVLTKIVEPDIPPESVTVTGIFPEGSEDGTRIGPKVKFPVLSDVPVPTVNPITETVTNAFGVKPVAVSVTWVPAGPVDGVSIAVAGVTHVLVTRFNTCGSVHVGGIGGDVNTNIAEPVLPLESVTRNV